MSGMNYCLLISDFLSRSGPDSVILRKGSSDFILLWAIDMNTRSPSLGMQRCHWKSPQDTVFSKVFLQSIECSQGLPSNLWFLQLQFLSFPEKEGGKLLAGYALVRLDPMGQNPPKEGHPTCDLSLLLSYFQPEAPEKFSLPVICLPQL